METLIVMGTSVGGVSALSTIFAALPANFPAAILAVMHVGARNSVLPEILGKTSALPVRFAEEREHVRAGRILLAPPDRHMLVANLAGTAVAVLNVNGFPINSQWHVVHRLGRKLSPIAEVFQKHLLTESRRWLEQRI